MTLSRHVGDAMLASSGDDRVGDTTASMRRMDFDPWRGPAGDCRCISLELMGERVAKARWVKELEARGLEEEWAFRPWYQVIPVVERHFARSGSLAAQAFCQAVEGLLAVEVPERAQWSRVLVCEVSRIDDHLGRLAQTCDGLGASMQVSWLKSGREVMAGWIDSLTGTRVVPHYLRIGGVSHAVPSDLAEILGASVRYVARLLADLDRTLCRSRSFVDRLRGVAALDPEQCVEFGVTGVGLRASGVQSDRRKTPGYSIYREIDFDVVVGSVGDNYDRFLVCVEEVAQSLRIVRQCIERLDALGVGATRASDPGIGWESRGRRALDIAEMIHHTMSVTSGPRVPAGRGRSCVEAANTELAFDVVSDGGPIPVSVRCVANRPDYARLIPRMLRGIGLSEVPTTLDLLQVSPVRWEP